MQSADKGMKYILDSSYFFSEQDISGDLWTTEEVREEVKDFASRARFNILLENGLKIGAPGSEELALVKATSQKSGDLRVLSDTDISVIALGKSLQGTVVSGDFAVQNVCRHLNISVISLKSKTAKKKVWKLICSGCGAEIPPGESECPICGSKPIMRGTEKSRH